MEKNKITGYVAAGLGCAAITFGICWYTMDYSRRDVIELGEKMAVVNECEKVMKEAQSRLIKRFVYAIIIFILVAIVQLVFNMIGNAGKDSTTDTEKGNIADCIDLFVNGND